MSRTKAVCYCLIFSFSTAFTSCRQDASNTPKSAISLTVTDFRGVKITLAKPATRIVCLIESALSGIYMLQAENQIIGISTGVYNESTYAQYAVLDERIKNKTLPAPGNWDFINIESIVALQPDLVIIWASQTESIQSIEKHGIPVYGVFLNSVNDVFKEIQDFGIMTGKNQRADSLVSYTKNEIKQLRSIMNITENEKKNIYFMWTQGLLETAGTTSAVNELIELAGAKNSCRISQEHVVINKERLLDWNPDIMVMWYNPLKSPDDIVKLSEMQHINAIKYRHVYEFPSVFLCDLWTLKFPYAVKLLAKWCYPASTEGLNMDTEKQKMLVMLYGEKAVTLIK
jgi:iron complex transport system substrate-binding protein